VVRPLLIALRADWNRNNSAALDISPACSQYLGITEGIATCSWRWASYAPPGPWHNNESAKR
jgi:hypothetical protein